jgi:hypothetical protein
MKIILKIGHYEYLLPNDQGVSTVAKLLAKAKHCDIDHRDGSYRDEDRIIRIKGGAPRIKVDYLPASTEIIDDTLPLGLPEHGHRES